MLAVGRALAMARAAMDSASMNHVYLLRDGGTVHFTIYYGASKELAKVSSKEMLDHSITWLFLHHQQEIEGLNVQPEKYKPIEITELSYPYLLDALQPVSRQLSAVVYSGDRNICPWAASNRYSAAITKAVVESVNY
ncbi:MAG: hypothetical protein LBI39_02715 [Puniceicoccales bacterium]|jgi:hypothetical protein|nr:hypothetical protein [Puniceicoccales bacterium]